MDNNTNPATSKTSDIDGTAGFRLGVAFIFAVLAVAHACYTEFLTASLYLAASIGWLYFAGRRIQKNRRRAK